MKLRTRIKEKAQRASLKLLVGVMVSVVFFGLKDHTDS